VSNNLSLWQKTPPIAAGHSWVMAISKKSAQSIILHSFPLPGPYTGQTQLHTFATIDDVMWYYQLFESPDGTPTGTVRNYFDVQPNRNTYATRDDLYLIADVSPYLVSGTAGYGIDPLAVDASLIGWNWSLERIGQGTRNVDVVYVKTKVISGVLTDTTKDDTDATGWRLLIGGDLVGPNEEWCIHFLPQLQSVVSSSSTNIISAIRVLTANVTLDNSALRQMFWLKGGAGYFEVTLPDLATIPDNEPIYFESSGGSHVNVGLKCVAGQTIQWYKNAADLASDTRATRIILGQEERLAICKVTLDDSSSRYLLLYGGEGAQAVGEIIMDYSKIPHNTIPAAGQILSKTTYARLWEWVQNLEAAAKVSPGSYDTVSVLDGINYYVNRGKFSDVDSSSFRLPTLIAGSANGTGFLRMVDGTTRLVASLQPDGVPDHQHEQTIGTLADAGLGIFGEGAIRDKGNYNSHSLHKTDLTGKNGLIVGSVFQNTEKSTYEARPVNVGIYGLIRI